MPTCMYPNCESCNPPQDWVYCDIHDVSYEKDDFCPDCEWDEEVKEFNLLHGIEDDVQQF